MTRRRDEDVFDFVLPSSTKETSGIIGKNLSTEDSIGFVEASEQTSKLSRHAGQDMLDFTKTVRLIALSKYSGKKLPALGKDQGTFMIVMDN